ncbi:MAG TPA: hypothetical protein EYQ75_04020, partial [Planctomycetaceae bacterium]|nr:hypothetical protein [Planctomycetaceae bacterium]
FVGHADAAEDRPNVLLIVIDDLNDWVACLGHLQAKMPTDPHGFSVGSCWRLAGSQPVHRPPTCHANARFFIVHPV